jgi:hypothetical protein
MVSFLQARNVALASGVPRQITGTFFEKLLIPLIHFVLLGFLPGLAHAPLHQAGLCGRLWAVVHLRRGRVSSGWRSCGHPRHAA